STVVTLLPVAPPPTTMNRTAGDLPASAATAATCAAPTATTTRHLRWTRLARYGPALAAVASPTTGRYCTFACVAHAASCIPAQARAAGDPAPPCSSVSKHAVNSRYGRARTGGGGSPDGHSAHVNTATSATALATAQIHHRRATAAPPMPARPL